MALLHIYRALLRIYTAFLGELVNDGSSEIYGSVVDISAFLRMYRALFCVPRNVESAKIHGSFVET